MNPDALPGPIASTEFPGWDQIATGAVDWTGEPAAELRAWRSGGVAPACDFGHPPCLREGWRRLAWSGVRTGRLCSSWRERPAWAASGDLIRPTTLLLPLGYRRKPLHPQTLLATGDERGAPLAGASTERLFLRLATADIKLGYKLRQMGPTPLPGDRHPWKNGASGTWEDQGLTSVVPARGSSGTG